LLVAPKLDEGRAEGRRSRDRRLFLFRTVLTARTIHRELQELANRRYAGAASRYFKTGPGEYGAGDRFLGIRVPVLRKLATKYQALSLRELSALLASPWHEERLLALLILVRQYARAAPPRRQMIYDLYMRQRARINNWDLVDCSAAAIIGAQRAEGHRDQLLRLAKSKNIWERRMAVIASFHDIKRGEFDEPLRLARLLLDDPHDLIHKAVGWMLREVGKRNRPTEEAFLREHAKSMPRTMLRYAIERFPDRLRRRYLTS
jgi:3-methyladenine DNA glycosylase AlkD